ncbi:MAG: helix-turn-helix domain-containing protein [Xanthomonadales bacterium]|nr:helix-turn-helix domain-containing protein [Xanthomonadales bacterium]
MTLRSNQAIEPSAAARLGKTLRTRRKALRITMVAAAEAAGMSRVTWHRLEKGEASVAWASVLAAAAVLGLSVQVIEEAGQASASPPLQAMAGWVPLHIPLAQFPGLRRLAWQVNEELTALSPREAYGLYERNARHLDEASLSDPERTLLRALRALFADAAPRV